jgi:leucyl-tRNA synthetase
VLLKYRLTYLAESVVNWCPALGTVLANDEVKDGVSERGGYPVERKKMKQWSMRITAYADRLLRGLDVIDWPEPLKEMQRNWIGKSLGAELTFPVKGQDLGLTVFTTRIDTIFGVTYLSIAPEHELIPQLTTPDQKAAVEEYVRTAANRSERDRMSDVKTVSGVFTGSYVTNPLTGEDVPLWIADYVLAGYGTGVVMGVPSSDDRDFRFAKHFNLPIVCVIEGTEGMENPTEVKYGRMINSGFLDGLDWQEAVRKAIEKAEGLGVGRAKVNFRMRDAVFSRQRYWGEPVPVYFKDDLPHLLDESELPLVLPEIDQYKPTETGEPPLGRAKDWKYQGQYEYELSTMPGWAGSSWYFFRYMDPHNDKEFCSKEAQAYWKDVDFYLGGSEHATGHLLYSRFWTKVLFDLGHVTVDEPFKKLVNQGMIQGRSNFIYRVSKKAGEEANQTFVSFGLKNQYDTVALHVDVNLVENDVLDVEALKKQRSDYANAEFILEDGKYMCGFEIEKMSKRWYNVVNPDDVVARYGADTLRMYEMFLGPLTDAKPWNTNGITGVHNFLRKYWRLFHTEKGDFQVSDAEPTKDELKALHKLIKKVADDVENLSLNTSVSAFMVCVNELSSLKCNKRAVLSELTVVLSSFAPHVAEETWHLLGNAGSVTRAPYPAYNESYLVEDSFEYPVSINGKVRAKMTFAADTAPAEIESSVLASEAVQKWLEGKQPKKIIVVPKRIVNVVL